ncbi:MAG: glycosyltransferase [Candidatus Latescibacteria bacterium]|nr:glycosyltransferase [bacterium]MBD3425190.1 glycosyltransferase [Candidatus Latescibacterota bacterium]
MGEFLMNLNDVTVIVPTKNERENIKPFLRSIPDNLKLIVVDASEDDTRDLIKRLRPKNTRVIYDPGNIPEARQRGADEARTEWLLFTDADVVFGDDYFSELISLELADQDGAVVGRKTSRGRYNFYYRFFALWLRTICFLGFPAGTGSNMLVKRSALYEAGGFDLDLTCNEDSMLTWCIHRCGYRVPYADNIRVYETDHRRLERGLIKKSLHSIFRCIILFSGFFTRQLRANDWGYWSGEDYTAGETGRDRYE